jgi:curved DNA-binding protein CbpA
MPDARPKNWRLPTHRTVGQWHPDRLNEAMAQELRKYATRRTQRINEAFQLLKQRA